MSPCLYLSPWAHSSLYFLSPAQLNRGVAKQLRWAPGIQPRLIHHRVARGLPGDVFTMKHFSKLRILINEHEYDTIWGRIFCYVVCFFFLVLKISYFSFICGSNVLIGFWTLENLAQFWGLEVFTGIFFFLICVMDLHNFKFNKETICCNFACNTWISIYETDFRLYFSLDKRPYVSGFSLG